MKAIKRYIIEQTMNESGDTLSDKEWKQSSDILSNKEWMNQKLKKLVFFAFSFNL